MTAGISPRYRPVKNIDEKLFRLLIDSVEDYAIFMIDPNGYVMSWNLGAEKIKGYTEQEITGKHISVFYMPEDIKKGEPLNNLNAALKKGSHESENWRVRKNGSVFFANVVFTTLYDNAGHLLGFAKVTRDITERKIAEEKQEEINARLEKRVKENTEKIIANELRFRQLIENSYDGITLFNHNLDAIYRSLSAERINGWSDNDITNQPLDDLIHPDDRHIVKNLFNEVKAQPGIPIKAIYRTRHKQGHYMWIESIFTNRLDDVNINAIVCNFRDVTERVKAEEEIINKTKQVENILESITDGFIALDNNFCYTYANASIGKMLGCDPQSLIGKYVWGEFPDAMNSETFKAFKNALETQKYVCNEDYYAPLNLWQENHIYPSAAGLSVFIRDITLRKNHEQLQKKNHELLLEAAETQAAILNALPPNIALLNEKGKIIAVNESWKKFAVINNLGLPDYGIGYNYLAFCGTAMGITDVDEVNVARGIKDVINGQNDQYTLEYPCHSKDEDRWFQLVVAPLTDSKHKGAVVLHINITDRKLAEASLVQSEANLRSVFENTDLAITLFDQNLKIVSFNTNAQKLSIRNYGKKLRPGNSAFNYFSKERKSFIKKITEKISRHESFNYETTYKLKDGDTEWYDVNWMGVVNKKDEIIGYIFTIKDITGKKLADIEREKITNDLVKRNADLEQFTYIISHNLRAPVANIMGLSRLLGGNDIQNDEGKEILKSLTSSVNSLDIVILDLNHILQTSKQINEKIEWVNLATIIDEIKGSIDHMIKRENVVINLNLKVAAVDTLKNYLYSIFYNLIINSIKYRRINVNPVIDIESYAQGDKIVISFKDNGKGIDMKKNGSQLFGLYKRFDFSVEGKGMGLFMVKIQMESLGGTINVKSELDSGTEFLLVFPVSYQN